MEGHIYPIANWSQKGKPSIIVESLGRGSKLNN